MTLRGRIFRAPTRDGVVFSVGDGVVLLIVVVVLYLGAQLAIGTPAVIQGPTINLDSAALSFYALLSIGRMLTAYTLSMVFSIFYGYIAAQSTRRTLADASAGYPAIDPDSLFFAYRSAQPDCDSATANRC